MQRLRLRSPATRRDSFDHLRELDQNGFPIAIANIYNAGIEIVKGIVKAWDCTYKKGIKPTNYIGDIFGSLGGKPDFRSWQLDRRRCCQAEWWKWRFAEERWARSEVSRAPQGPHLCRPGAVSTSSRDRPICI